VSQIVEDGLSARVRLERESRGWSLTDLAEASGVSRAMINRIERGESSPTAVLLGKLSGAFHLTTSELLARSETPRIGLVPAAAAPRWMDPATGYSRRQVSAPGFPADLVEVTLPPGARVTYPASAFAFNRHLVWALEGELAFLEGDDLHRLSPGDSLELGAPAECTYINAGDEPCRYAVLVVRTG